MGSMLQVPPSVIFFQLSKKPKLCNKDFSNIFLLHCSYLPSNISKMHMKIFIFFKSNYTCFQVSENTGSFKAHGLRLVAYFLIDFR